MAQRWRIRRSMRTHGFDPWVGKILWRRKWQPIPVFLLGKSHGQRNLEGYSPWGSQNSWIQLSNETTRTHCGLLLKLFRDNTLIGLWKWDLNPDQFDRRLCILYCFLSRRRMEVFFLVHSNASFLCVASSNTSFLKTHCWSFQKFELHFIQLISYQPLVAICSLDK